MCLAATLAAVPGATAAAAPAPAPAGTAQATDELIVPAAQRVVPRATRILNAGTTGFLWAQEGDDRLLWTGYATGDTTALEQRLPEPVRYDFDGWWPSAPSFHPGWYGRGSDTVALYSAEPSPQVTLLQGASGGSTVQLPEGRTYQGTFGGAILTRTDGHAFHLLRDGAETPVTGLPAGITESEVEDGDAHSVVVRFRTDDGAEGWGYWGLIELTTGTFTRLPDRPEPEYAWAVTGMQLAPGAVLRMRGGRNKVDVFDRNDLSAPRYTIDAGSYTYEAAHGLAGSRLLSVEPVWPGNGIYRGQPLWATPIDAEQPAPSVVMNPAAHQIVQAPDGSALVAGAHRYAAEGDLDWGIYRITQASDGSLERHRVTQVEPMPAQVHGLAVGSGIMSIADQSTAYSPGSVLGAYRSTWLTTAAGVPAVERTTVDGRINSSDGSCSPGTNPYCIRLFADGTGYHGREEPNDYDLTMLYQNGVADTWNGPSINTKNYSPRLADLSGRYAVIDGANRYDQFIGEFRYGTAGVVLQEREWIAAAVWGSTLWSGGSDRTWTEPVRSPVVTATRLPTGAVVETFSTSNGCIPTRLQAVGRWVHWACVEDWGLVRGSGVWDRVAKRHIPAPATDVLLGDGYLVEQVAGPDGGLRLIDLYGQLPTRMLVGADDLGDGAAPHISWTVDRFGGHVAYADRQQRIHIVPTGVPASALNAIDSAVSNSATAWSGTWWLSKPAASWQLTFRNATGATIRTISGSSARGVLRAKWDGKDAAGRAVPNGTFTWTLTAQPADGAGPALTVAGPPVATLKATKAPTISGTLAVGSTVKAAPGTWSPTATSYAYQWSANGAAIKGATGQSLKLTSAMLGKRLTVKVTAKRSGHPSGTATSAASAKIAKGKAPKATKRSSIAGTPKVGRTVKANVGVWSPKADSYRYEWRLNGKLIKGATKRTLKLKSSMRGKKLTVTVVARKAGHTDGKSTSKAVTVRR